MRMLLWVLAIGLGWLLKPFGLIVVFGAICFRMGQHYEAGSYDSVVERL